MDGLGLETRIDLLWRLHDDHQQMARHHDAQRSTLTGYVLFLAAAAVGVAKIGEVSTLVTVVLAIFVAILGIVGVKLVKVHSAECADQNSCANKYRLEIESLIPSLAGDEPAAKDRYPNASPWHVLNLLVIGLGLALVACAYLHA